MSRRRRTIIFPRMTHTRVLSDSLTLTVNGSTRQLTAGSSVADLLRTLGVDAQMVVVEHNRAILRDRRAFSSLLLAEGDSLEIVHFVGGG